MAAELVRAPVPRLPPEQLFEQGIERFDVQDYPGTRAFMRALLDRYPGHDLRDMAVYFDAVTYWREQDPHQTIRSFQALLARHPNQQLVGAAYFHIGLAHRQLGRRAEAREAFEAAVRLSGPQDPERGYALDALEHRRPPAPFAGAGRAITELVYRLQADADRLGAYLGLPEP